MWQDVESEIVLCEERVGQRGREREERVTDHEAG